MSRIPWNKGKHISKFCPQGHNKDVVGRTNNGSCSVCIANRTKKWQEENKEFLTEYHKKWNAVHNPPHPRPKKQFCSKGHDTFVCGRTSSGNCKTCDSIYKVNLHLKKMRENPKYRLIQTLRIRLYHAIKLDYKSGSAVKDLGCSIEFLKQYIESKFQSDMTWDNWGKVWELDHIKELADFDLTDREQFLKAVHYTNLQPLTVRDHLQKTTKYNLSRNLIG